MDLAPRFSESEAAARSAVSVKAHLRYGSYVARHKWFVLRAGLKTKAPLWRLLIHDWSKMTPAEWGPYVRSFYGPQPRTDAAKCAFNAAWLHHQHHNPHHWQHWLLREDRGDLKMLAMPERFVREMVADWMGAGRAIGGLLQPVCGGDPAAETIGIPLHR